LQCDSDHLVCLPMKMDRRTDTVWFTTKGQLVIPLWIRKEFQIEEGSRAIVEVTDEGILLRPVTKKTVGQMRGILKRKPAGKNSEEGEHGRHSS
jgi:AbrB family looped-hinge helix DNA binding protein